MVIQDFKVAYPNHTPVLFPVSL